VNLSLRLRMGETGWIHCDIIPSYNPNSIIITGLNIEHDRIEHAKNIIEEKLEEIIEKLKTYYQNSELIQSTFDKLKEEIKHIVHEGEILGIYGECKIEKELQIRTTLNNKLKLFFRRK
jgi:hypothetical protein